ncbi:hypothetical protein [Arthrobacter sp. ISL-65]|uniref:hypothetical protein n=1 Tax=Arthrobacter sp. ISL-65 TaxID=2819112 RepID=UPI001BE80AD5|nr:hypothetical protein [Arthrobacter sp. ISL-65]MBT2548619.1 hypothetical protein [Arthrobacter sp. ISL-65]
MFTLQIEHAIKDFDMWKAAFDRDPADRAGSGVVAHRIGRPVEDDRSIVLELDFERRDQAEGFLAKLRENVWNSPDVAPALSGSPQTRVIELVG